MIRLCVSAALLLFAAGLLQAQELRLVVLPPPSTPPADTLYVTGSDTALGNWNPPGKALVRENDSVWSLRGTFTAGSEIEFKITRGSWETEALYTPGVVPPNTVLTVARDTVVTLRPVGWADSVTAHRQPVQNFAGKITGAVRYHRGLTDMRLKYSRDCIVWLPPSYATRPERRFPVLYMHDGQNVFDPSTSFAKVDWQVDEAADSLITAGAMQEIIMVGLYNSADRRAEYGDGPAGRAYCDFACTTVKPLIDSTYRTLPDRAHTAVMGSSSGGLISFLFAWWRPDVFSAAASLSGAFLPRITSILDTVRNNHGPRHPLRIYLDCGTGGVDRELLPGNEQLYALLKKQGFVEGKDVTYYFADGADHNEAAWAARTWRPLVFLFGTR
jgi:enterochelin esterase-like enzyme